MKIDAIAMEGHSDNCSNIRIKPVGDPVTKQDVEQAVNLALGSAVKIVNYRLRNYSEERLGFLGAHRFLIVTVQTEGSEQKEIKTFFLKSVPYDVEVQASRRRIFTDRSCLN